MESAWICPPKHDLKVYLWISQNKKEVSFPWNISYQTSEEHFHFYLPCTSTFIPFILFSSSSNFSPSHKIRCGFHNKGWVWISFIRLSQWKHAVMDTCKRIRVVMTSLLGHRSLASFKNKARDIATMSTGNCEIAKDTHHRQVSVFRWCNL